MITENGWKRCKHNFMALFISGPETPPGLNFCDLGPFQASLWMIFKWLLAPQPVHARTLLQVIAPHCQHPKVSTVTLTLQQHPQNIKWRQTVKSQDRYMLQKRVHETPLCPRGRPKRPWWHLSWLVNIFENFQPWFRMMLNDSWCRFLHSVLVSAQIATHKAQWRTPVPKLPETSEEEN